METEIYRRDFRIYNGTSMLTIQSVNSSQANDFDDIPNLVRSGLAVPILLNEKAEFVNFRVVVGGSLLEIEDREWVGHISWYLKAPDGAIVILGGRPTATFDENSRTVNLTSGNYLLDVYTYIHAVNSFDCLLEAFGGEDEINVWTEELDLSSSDTQFVEQLLHFRKSSSLNPENLQIPEGFDLGFPGNSGSRVPSAIPMGIQASF